MNNMAGSTGGGAPKGGTQKSGVTNGEEKEGFGKVKKAFQDNKSNAGQKNSTDEQIEDGQEEAGSVQDTAKSSGKGKEGAKKTAEATKKGKQIYDALKGIESLAPIISALGVIAIVLLIIFLIIGIVGFFTTMPGLAMEKIKETASNFWSWALGTQNIYNISEEDVIDLAEYIDELGYDLVGCGFVPVGSVKRENKENNTGAIKSIDCKMGDTNLYSYILANEKTYTVYLGGENLFDKAGKLIGKVNMILPGSDIFSGIVARRSIINVYEEFDTVRKGMLIFDDIRENDNTKIEIDRVNNKLVVKEGFFQTDQVNYDLNGWTGRYGKPIELSLALHLSTMAPDFVRNFCLDKELQTEVHISTVEREYDIKYYFETEDGTVLDKDKVDEAYETLKDAVQTSQDFTGTDWRGKRDEDVSLFTENGAIEYPYVPIQMLDDLSTMTFKYQEDITCESRSTQWIALKDSNNNPIKFYDDSGNAKKFSLNVSDITVDSHGKLSRIPQFIEGGSSEFNVVFSLDDISKSSTTIDEIINQGIGNVSFWENKEVYTNGLYVSGIGLSMNDLIIKINNGTFSDNDKINEEEELGWLMKQIDKLIADINKYTNNLNDDSNESLIELTHKFIAHHDSSYKGKYSSSGGYYHKNFTEILQADYSASEKIEKLKRLREDCKADYEIIQEAVMLIMADSSEVLDKCGGISVSTLKLLHEFFNGEAEKVNTYEPYITKVTHHWYKDVYFIDKETGSYEGFYDLHEDGSGATKTKREEYNPEGLATDNETLNKLNEEGTIYAEMTGSFIEQLVQQPQFVKDEPWHYMVKNWLTNGYYFIYDGTTETAKEIESAKKYLKEFGYDSKNPLLVDYDNTGLLTGKDNEPLDVATINEIEAKAKELNNKLAKADYTYQDNNGENKTRKYRVRLQKINFAKKSSLAAFSILEGVHTVDGEHVYQDLKNFMIELGYFSEGDFETIESNVLSWMIPDYTPDEWPDGRYEKKNDKYGTYIRSKSSIQAEKEKENGNENQDKESQNQNNQSGNGTTGNGNSKSSSTQGFEKDLDVIAPEQCIVINIEKGNTSDCITIKFTSQNKVKDMTMKIKGIKLNEDIEENKTIEKQAPIGKTTEDDIQLLMRDSKKAIINNIEDYMKPPSKIKKKANSGGGTIPLYSTSLSRQEFIEGANNYSGITGTEFEGKMGEFYDICTKNGINPVIAFTRAIWESSLQNSNHNFWGLDAPNGSSAPQLADTMLGTLQIYCDRLNSYSDPTTDLYKMIMEKYNERKECTDNGGCNPSGYGTPDTIEGIMSIYSYLGKHETGGSGSGGYYYMDPAVANVTAIYESHEEFVELCKNKHTEGTESTIWEQAQYTAYQVKLMADTAEGIWGEGALK